MGNIHSFSLSSRKMGMVRQEKVPDYIRAQLAPAEVVVVEELDSGFLVE